MNKALLILFFGIFTLGGCASSNKMFVGVAQSNCNEYDVQIVQMPSGMYVFELREQFERAPKFVWPFELVRGEFAIYNFNGDGDYVQGFLNRDGSFYGYFSDRDCHSGILGNFAGSLISEEE